jgi:predicted metal-dependent phosphoesterase TrpH
MTTLINVDLHCHTIASEDGHIQLDNLIEACDRRDILKLAITDHNTIEGALEAASRWPTRIIPGLEIMTKYGELLAYYVNKPVEPFNDPLDTIMKLKAQGAVISVSHPFDPWRNGGWKSARLLEILPYLDAIEVFNAHCISNIPNVRAQSYADGYHLSGTAGSDAHYTDEIGVAGLTLEDFHDSVGLRKSLNTAKIFGRRTSLITRFVNRVRQTNR